MHKKHEIITKIISMIIIKRPNKFLSIGCIFVSFIKKNYLFMGRNMYFLNSAIKLSEIGDFEKYSIDVPSRRFLI